jgi:hypothetical protein
MAGTLHCDDFTFRSLLWTSSRNLYCGAEINAVKNLVVMLEMKDDEIFTAHAFKIFIKAACPVLFGVRAYVCDRHASMKTAGFASIISSGACRSPFPLRISTYALLPLA